MTFYFFLGFWTAGMLFALGLLGFGIKLFQVRGWQIPPVHWTLPIKVLFWPIFLYETFSIALEE